MSISTLLDIRRARGCPAGPPSRRSDRGGARGRCRFRRTPELLQGIVAHRLQQPVAGSLASVFHHDKGLVDQQSELIEDLVVRHSNITAADDPGAVEVKAAAENRQPAKQDAFGRAQQGVRPVHRCSQSLLAAHRGARAPRQ